MFRLVGVYLKLRGWLLLLVFVHVMLHPWVHAVGTSRVANGISVASTNSTPDTGLAAGDRCELCRVGHTSAAAQRLPQVDLLNPHWIFTALQAVNYASLQADLRRPSRAPPIL